MLYEKHTATRGLYLAAYTSWCFTLQLTPLRLNNNRSFLTRGIDHLGPLYIKNVFNKYNKVFKKWAAIYSCTTTRSIIPEAR